MTIQLIDLLWAEAIDEDDTEYSEILDLGFLNLRNWKFGLRATHAGGTSTRTVVIQNSNTKTGFVSGTTVETTSAVGTAYTDISAYVIPSKFIRFSILALTGDITSCDIQLAIG